MLTERALQQVRRIGDQSTDIEWFGVERLMTREGEQPVSECRGTLDTSHGSLREAQQRSAVGRHPTLQQLDVAADDSQVVVEVVCDATGQATDHFQLLRPAQGFLRCLTPLPFIA